MLMLYLGEAIEFDLQEVKRIWSRMKGVTNLNDQDGLVACSLECDYEFDADRVIVRLADDFETVTIHGSGPAAQDFICEFRQMFGRDFHLIDEAYNFDHLVGKTVARSEILEMISS